MQIDNERLARRISELAGSCRINQDMLERVKATQKMLDIYSKWDGWPTTLDTDSFTMEELYTALDEVASIEEYESRQNIQQDNVLSLIISARSIMACLLDVSPVKRKVTYL